MIQAVKWDSPKSASGVNDYMELLVKETVTLHKVLSRYLAIPILEVIYLAYWATSLLIPPFL